MKVTKKGSRITTLLSRVLESMKNHNSLKPEMGRNSMKETDIQKSVFSDLNYEVLPKIISDIYNYSENHCEKIVKENFNFENKTTCHVNSFPFFSVRHRPDAEFLAEDSQIGINIGFEIKKGKKGDSIRSGIGQSVVYATKYDFVLYFFVDTSQDMEIRNVVEGEKESALIESLWDNYNIKFVIV